MNAWLLHVENVHFFLRRNQTSLTEIIHACIAKHKNYTIHACMHVIHADVCEHGPNTASIVAPIATVLVIILIIMILLFIIGVVLCCVRKYRKKNKVR